MRTSDQLLALGFTHGSGIVPQDFQPRPKTDFPAGGGQSHIAYERLVAYLIEDRCQIGDRAVFN